MTYIIDTTITPQENYFLAEQHYSNNFDMTTITVDETNEMVGMYARLTIMIKQYNDKKQLFFNARDAAFNALSIKQDEERQALGKLWQTEESNGYII